MIIHHSRRHRVYCILCNKVELFIKASIVICNASHNYYTNGCIIINKHYALITRESKRVNIFWISCLKPVFDVIRISDLNIYKMVLFFK